MFHVSEMAPPPGGGGTGIVGNSVTVARTLSKKAHIVMVVYPDRNPLGADPGTITTVQKNLEELGVIMVLSKNASEDFFQPVIQDYVLSGLAAGASTRGRYTRKVVPSPGVLSTARLPPC